MQVPVHGPHKEDHFQGLDIGARGNHIHGNGNAWEIAGAKFGNQVLGFPSGGSAMRSLAEKYDMDDSVYVEVKPNLFSLSFPKLDEGITG